MITLSFRAERAQRAQSRNLGLARLAQVPRARWRGLPAFGSLGMTAWFCAASRLSAQVAPNLDWRTLPTQHFYVHFTPPLEGLARRIAADAERAYAQLARELVPPRDMIDVVLSDDVDFSNGSATPSPSPRIVIYANPPVSESALRYTNDWGQLVLTHELTHIFHLDRARGIWALGQHIFGRPALLFPNFYSPSWLTEGLAVYYESRLAGAGRIEGSEHRMIARAAAADHVFPGIGALSLSYGRFPFGETAYAFGSLFVDYMARTHGDTSIRRFVDKSAAQIIPYLPDVPARQSFGITFSRAYAEWRDSIARSVTNPQSPVPLPGWKELTNDGVFVYDPRWRSDSSIIYSGTPGRESFAAYTVDLNGRRTSVGRRNSRSANIPLADGSLLYAQLDLVNPYQERSDLWIQRGGRERQLTWGARLQTPDARADGEIVASQITPGATRLVRVSRDGKTITPITTGTYDEQWTEPRWSHSGDRIVASRWLRGNVSQVVVIDTAGRILHVVSSGNSIEATPSWLAGDAGIVYSSDRTGVTQLYVERFASPADLSRATTYRVSDVVTGLFEPQAAPSGDHAATVLFRGDGYHLGVGTCCAAGGTAVPAYLDTAVTRVAAPIVDSGVARAYSPWRTFRPRYWLPTLNQGIENSWLYGAQTSGRDVVGRHAFAASIGIPSNNSGIVSAAAYEYSGFGLPIIDLSASQDWVWLGNYFARDASKQVLGTVRRRVRDAEMDATWVRQRVRSAISVTGGVGVEHRDHFAVPVEGGTPVTLGQIDTTGSLGTPTYPRLVFGAGYANYQRPPFSISAEDGVILNLTIRDRLKSGVAALGASTLSTVASAVLLKSFDFPGYAHHVLALRGAAGYADERSNGFYQVGGISGNPFEVIPGYTIGEGRKTFPVRGFAPGQIVGTRAFATSAEYRVPLLLTSHAPGILPFFFDRSSLTVFGDYGSAWCPSARAGRETCISPSLTRHIAIGSVGAELNLNAGILSWDAPTRFRLGVALPLQNQATFGRSKVQVYYAAGVSF